MKSEKNNDKRLLIVLFGHPRSGSNTLMKIINLHPKLDLLSQPFNETRHVYAKDERNYRKEVQTIEDLDRILNEIDSQYNGFKTFSFQLPEEFNVYLLTKRGYKIIFLNRKNHLKSVVSKFIAEQTKIWTADEKEQRQNQPDTLNSIDINAVRGEVEYLKSDYQKYSEILDRANIQLINILYENLFTELEDDRMKEITRLFQFLELETSPEMEAEIRRLLSPKRKINDIKTYNLIPNIQEIEQTLGSEESGYLFK